MPDDPKLKVVIEGDASSVVGASKEASTAIKEVADETGNTGAKVEHATEQYEKLGGKTRELHEVLMLISRTSGPGAGAAVGTAALAMTGGITAAVLAIRELYEWFDRLQKKAEEVREAQASIWMATQKGIADAAAAADDFNAKLDAAKSKQDDLEKSFEQQKSVLDAMIDQHKKILEAMEQEELAAAQGDKAKEDAIKQRYDDIKKQYDLQAEQEKIDQQRKELAAITARQQAEAGSAEDLKRRQEDLLKQSEVLKNTPDLIASGMGFSSAADAEKALRGQSRFAGSGADLAALIASTQQQINQASISGQDEKAQQLMMTLGPLNQLLPLLQAKDAITANSEALKNVGDQMNTAASKRDADAAKMEELTNSIDTLTKELVIHTQTVQAQTALEALGKLGGAPGVASTTETYAAVVAQGGQFTATQLEANKELAALLKNMNGSLAVFLEIVRYHNTMHTSVAQEQQAMWNYIRTLLSQMPAVSQQTISQ